jgi:eukaryotic-like serine/threonine-protein kinase
MIGKTLGHYQITSQLGKGGMGEVYQAKDLKLGRDVAIKVLPKEFSKDSDRIARFQREAKLLASLNHLNIAAIYGLEESGGTNFLVLELVQGETLADRIKKGPIPVEESLKLALQIAEALEAAHEKGVIHRDLKPANIKITPEDKVKVLDFGLAKAFAGEQSEINMTNSPTLSLAATQAGVILGTAAYMSPEQAKGRPVDRRADIWAFGVILYEMLTGRQLFQGETVTDVLASVVMRELSWDEVPAKARRLLQACLERDPRRRLRDIGDAWRELEEPAEKAGRVRHRWFWPAMAGACLTITAAVLVWTSFRPSPLPEVTRFQIYPPPGSRLPLGTPAISPDGRTLVYTVTGPDGITRLHVRPLDSLESRSLPGTEGAVHPFFSPDGRSVAFAANKKLNRIDLAGGGPVFLADTIAPWQGTWNQDGTILFVGGNGTQRISASGGETMPVIAERDRASVGSYPYFLRDGKRFLVRSRSSRGDDHGAIELATLGSFERKMVLDDVLSAGIPAPAPDGTTYLLYLRQTNLMAQRFDEKSGAVIGAPMVIVPGIGRVASPMYMPAFGVSSAGTVAYQTWGAAPGRLAWFDRSGKRLSELSPEAAGDEPSLAPDGRAVAVTRLDSDFLPTDLWVTDLIRGASSRFTFGNEKKSSPVWSSDGKRLAYHGTVNGIEGIYEKEQTGAGGERLLLRIEGGTPCDFSSDGRYLLYNTQDWRLFLLPLTGEKKPFPVGSPNGISYSGKISHDGKLIAFVSQESGRAEVYIQPMPPEKGQWQVSLTGGTDPVWRRDGKELFFLSPDQKMMSAEIRLPQFSLGVPRELFQAAVFRNSREHYDVSADGQRFLIYTIADAVEVAPITVVLNWWAALKK